MRGSAMMALVVGQVESWTRRPFPSSSRCPARVIDSRRRQTLSGRKARFKLASTGFPPSLRVPTTSAALVRAQPWPRRSARIHQVGVVAASQPTRRFPHFVQRSRRPAAPPTHGPFAGNPIGSTSGSGGTAPRSFRPATRRRPRSSASSSRHRIVASACSPQMSAQVALGVGDIVGGVEARGWRGDGGGS